MTPADRLSRDEIAIFLFHGVVERSDYEVRNYTRKHLTRDAFVAIIDSLASAGRPISLPDIVARSARGDPFPPRAFAVTFDDGFENNYSIAAPILCDFEVPATFYVTSGFIQHNALSWIDRIEYFMEHTPRGVLRLPWSGEAQRFDDRDSKIFLLEQIRLRAKRDPELDVDTLVRDVFVQGGWEEIEASEDPLDRKMEWDQVAALAAHDLFTVGGHGHTHRILSFLSDDAMEEEVSTCLRLLAEEASITTSHYSYPEGLEYCYSDRVVDALRRHGIVCCPTAQDGTNSVDDGLFSLKRIPVT